MFCAHREHERHEELAIARSQTSHLCTALWKRKDYGWYSKGRRRKISTFERKGNRGRYVISEHQQTALSESQPNLDKPELEIYQFLTVKQMSCLYLSISRHLKNVRSDRLRYCASASSAINIASRECGTLSCIRRKVLDTADNLSQRTQDEWGIRADLSTMTGGLFYNTLSEGTVLVCM